MEGLMVHGGWHISLGHPDSTGLIFYKKIVDKIN